MQVMICAKYFALLFALFGTSIPDGSPLNILSVEGSLLEPRTKPTPEKDGSSNLDEKKMLLLFRDSNDSRNLKNVSSFLLNDEQEQEEQVIDEGVAPLESSSSRRKMKQRDHHGLLVPLSDIRETEAMIELTTVSIYSINFLDEKESHIPTTTFQGEEDDSDTAAAATSGSTTNNDSTEEIFLSVPRNVTDHFGWTELGWADVALVTLFCSIIAGTVAGNMLVIAAVITTRRLRTVTNCFVMSLAVADWLVGMFVMPPKVFLYLVDNEWRFGRIICELWISLDILLCTASILSLCAISIDRYLAITRPLAYSRRRRSKRLALSMISCVWIAAVVITSPPIFGWYEENRNTANKCEYNENTGYVVYSALGSFFLPLLVMLYVYARIACVITRRQRSIQKLHSRGDRKSQYCGSDAEEPLHQKDREDEGGKAENVDTQPSHRPTTRLSSSTMLTAGDGGGVEEVENRTLLSSQIGHPHQLHGSIEKQSSADTEPEATRGGGGFLGRFSLSSCTSANNEDGVNGKSSNNKKKNGDRLARQSNTLEKGAGLAENPAIALSLPDPATLASASGTAENSSSSGTEHESGCGGVGPCGCSTSSTNTNQVQSQQPQHHRTNSALNSQQRANPQHSYVSRMKTGSRLCHHSIATASPQKNIHRIHQGSSLSGRNFGDDEPHIKIASSCRSLDRSPRVWTVETTSASPSTGGKRKGKDCAKAKSTSNCKSCSYEHELAEAGNSSAEKSPTQQMESVMMECSPAGNPASIMGAASASGNNSSIISPSLVHDNNKRSPFANRIPSSRIYQPHHVTPNSHHHHHHIIPNNQLQMNPTHSATTTPTTAGIRRARSMKFVPHIHTNDQNHNGGTATREFSSGRIASFKRETKTAQTLAAVVGGFIICWLPFFVAYVMAPFTPTSDTIPSALMDALIWLGWSNSAINPFIYAFYSADFRSAFWRLTVHKCSALLRNRNQLRNSPRRYEDPPRHQQHQQQHKTST